MPNTTLLDTPQEQLPVSMEFHTMMQGLHFACLRDLLAYPAFELLKMKGFDYRMLKELLSLLENNHLTDALKEEE